MRKPTYRDDAAILAILLITVAAMGTLNPRFFRADNLLEMSRFFVEAGLVALAMAPVMISGGIDLSVGSIMGLSVVAAGLGWRLGGLPPAGAIALACLVGLGAGLLNGLFVARLRIPPLIVTLATMARFRVVALGVGARAPVSDFPPSYYELGQGYYTVLGTFQMPQQLPVFLVMAGLCIVALHRSVLGRYTYAIGHNETAARLAGVPVERVKTLLYSFSGLMAGLAGAIFLSRVATAKADAGTLMELDVITICVLGGVSIYGGKGSLWGVLLGLLTVSSLVRGLTLARVPFDEQKMALGALLLAAALTQHFLQARALRKGSVEVSAASPGPER